MTGDPVRSVPLPSGPASLCFEKDDFMKVRRRNMTKKSNDSCLFIVGGVMKRQV